MSDNSQSQSKSLRLLSGSSSGSFNGGRTLDEEIIVIVLKLVNWDMRIVSRLACLCWKFHAIASNKWWKTVCISRAPRMMPAFAKEVIIHGHRCISDEWQTLAKVLFYCCGGCWSTQHFPKGKTVADHLVEETRFSKTSGQDFLIKQFRDDVLYVSDPCKHNSELEDEEDILIFGGVFREFPKSKTRAHLIKYAQLEENVRCPYCRCRAWSMMEARLIPKRASWRLGCDEGRLEYFVCLNGHMHGSCWLTPVSSDEDGGDDIDSMEVDDLKS